MSNRYILTLPFALPFMLLGISVGFAFEATKAGFLYGQEMIEKFAYTAVALAERRKPKETK